MKGGGKKMKSNLSEEEFDEVYSRYNSLLYRIAFTYLKNKQDVADLLQEVFVKRVYNAPVFETEEYEKRWMICITVNMAKNHIKSFWKRKVTQLENILEMPECNGWQLNERDKEVYMEVMSLPGKQRIAMYLHYFEGYTCKEIACILHCNESAVKMRLKKGRDLTGVILQDDCIGDLTKVKLHRADITDGLDSMDYKSGEKYKSPIKAQITVSSDKGISQKYNDREYGFVSEQRGIDLTKDSQDASNAELYNIEKLGIKAVLFDSQTDGPISWGLSDDQITVVNAVFVYKGIEYVYMGGVDRDTLEGFLEMLG